LLSEAQTESRSTKSKLTNIEAENSKLQSQLRSTERDLEERTSQLLTIQRSIGVLPRNSTSLGDWNSLKVKTLENVDLAKRLEEALIALQVMQEAKAALERRVQNASNWKEEVDQSGRQWRSMEDVVRPRSRESSPLRSLPSRLMRERTGSISSLNSVTTRSETDSNGSDDLVHRKHTQGLRNEIEDLTTRLELSEIQRKRLETRVNTPTHTRQNSESDMFEVRRLQRENARLHELLDEKSERTASVHGLSVPSLAPNKGLEQTLKSLESSKQKLSEQQNQSLRELTKTRAELDKALVSSRNTERDIKSLKQQLDAEQSARQAEQKVHQQSMTEAKNFKIRMQTMSGKVDELEDTIKMHKSRSEDLQNRLEETEIAAHNAMRSESYARGQLQEVESALATAINEQRKAEDTIIDLQKELRVLEGKVIVVLCAC